VLDICWNDLGQNCLVVLWIAVLWILEPMKVKSDVHVLYFWLIFLCEFGIATEGLICLSGVESNMSISSKANGTCALRMCARMNLNDGDRFLVDGSCLHLVNIGLCCK
jgi:hypothetical protein